MRTRMIYHRLERRESCEALRAVKPCFKIRHSLDWSIVRLGINLKYCAKSQSCCWGAAHTKDFYESLTNPHLHICVTMKWPRREEKLGNGSKHRQHALWFRTILRFRRKCFNTGGYKLWTMVRFCNFLYLFDAIGSTRMFCETNGKSDNADSRLLKRAKHKMRC